MQVWHLDESETYSPGPADPHEGYEYHQSAFSSSKKNTRKKRFLKHCRRYMRSLLLKTSEGRRMLNTALAGMRSNKRYSTGLPCTPIYRTLSGKSTRTSSNKPSVQPVIFVTGATIKHANKRYQIHQVEDSAVRVKEAHPKKTIRFSHPAVDALIPGSCHDPSTRGARKNSNASLLSVAETATSEASRWTNASDRSRATVSTLDYAGQVNPKAIHGRARITPDHAQVERDWPDVLRQIDGVKGSKKKNERRSRGRNAQHGLSTKLQQSEAAPMSCVDLAAAALPPLIHPLMTGQEADRPLSITTKPAQHPDLPPSLQPGLTHKSVPRRTRSQRPHTIAAVPDKPTIDYIPFSGDFRRSLLQERTIFEVEETFGPSQSHKTTQQQSEEYTNGIDADHQLKPDTLEERIKNFQTEDEHAKTKRDSARHAAYYQSIEVGMCASPPGMSIASPMSFRADSPMSFLYEDTQTQDGEVGSNSLLPAMSDALDWLEQPYYALEGSTAIAAPAHAHMEEAISPKPMQQEQQQEREQQQTKPKHRIPRKPVPARSTQDPPFPNLSQTANSNTKKPLPAQKMNDLRYPIFIAPAPFAAKPQYVPRTQDSVEMKFRQREARRSRRAEAMAGWRKKGVVFVWKRQREMEERMREVEMCLRRLGV